LAFWARTRSARVLVPRARRKPACGSSEPPRRLSVRRTRSTFARLDRTHPATRSEWPLRYFVALWNDTSNPIDRGRKLTGLAKVLSTIAVRRSWRANSTIWRRRGTRINGLVMVSTRNIRVPGRRACFQESGL